MGRSFIYKIGCFLQKMARYCFIAETGVCWKCGKIVGAKSTIADGVVWCDDCLRSKQ